MGSSHTSYELHDMEITVTGDYKYPFKCIRRVICLPQFPQQYESNSNAFALFATVYPQETAGTYLNEIHLWADGTVPAGTYVEINLKDGRNGNPEKVYVYPLSETSSLNICQWAAGYEFVNAVSYLLGLNQPDDLPSMVTVSGSNNIHPHTVRWDNGVAIFTPSNPINKYIGSSMSEKLTITSDYKDSNNISHICYGALTNYISTEGDEFEGFKIIVPKPTLIYNEPLTSNIYLEALDGVFIKNELHSPNIIVESLWKDSPIRKQLIVNEGTSNEKTISYPLPQVIFKVNNSSVTLTSYVVNSGYYRTSIYKDALDVNRHVHATMVDDSGNGVTDVSIILKGNVVSHTHTVTNFIALESLDDPNHTHVVECVAVTQINPTIKDDPTMTVSAYIPYDPTTAQVSVFPSDYPNITGINRIAKETLAFETSSDNIDPTIPTRPILTVDVFTASQVASNPSYAVVGACIPAYSTSQTPYDYANGIDIGVRAYFSKYIYEDSPGHYIIKPARNVDNGTRITIENIYQVASKVQDSTASSYSDQLDSFINGGGTSVDQFSNKSRPYLLLKTKAYVSSEGQVAEGNTAAKVVSSLQWIPDVGEMVIEPTKNKNTLLDILSNVSASNTFAIGPSQIYDGVTLAANRMIDFNFSNSNGSSYTKMIVLTTDGDENMSQNSLSQAAQIINSIDGNQNVPIISIIIGDANTIDQLVVTKLSNETGGIVETIKGLSSSGILGIIKDIFKSGSLSYNKGTYRVIQQTSPGLPISISLENVTVPVNSSVQYRYRTSEDGINWTAYSGLIDYNTFTSIPESMTNMTSYYEYEVIMNTNEFFQSPHISQAPKVTYLEEKENIVFFNENNLNQNALEYMTSVLVTYSGVVPDTSKITYGISQSMSTDPNDYTIAGNDLRSDKQEILLSRYNEIMVTSNYKLYKAINGRWVNGAKINIYKYNSSMLNGILVDPSSYTTSYENGTISFITPQDKSFKFVICIELPSLFKLICKVKNYGSKAAIIDHIGMIYNVAKRIPTSINGTIINKNIADRLGY